MKVNIILQSHSSCYALDSWWVDWFVTLEKSREDVRALWQFPLGHQVILLHGWQWSWDPILSHGRILHALWSGKEVVYQLENSLSSMWKLWVINLATVIWVKIWKQTQQPRDSQDTTGVLHPTCHCWNLLAKPAPIPLQNPARSPVPRKHCLILLGLWCIPSSDLQAHFLLSGRGLNFFQNQRKHSVLLHIMY